MTKTLCIYHANCADGLVAAWTVRRALGGGNVELVAASYGKPPPRVTQEHQWIPEGDEVRCTACGAQADENDQPCLGRDVLIVDFSYPLATLRAMAQEARSVLVLDHHATAREDLAQIALTVREIAASAAVELTGFPKLSAIFDMERSGAGLAWDYLNPDQPRPRIVDLVEDRDLWRFKFGDESRAFHAVLTSYDIVDLPTMFRKLDIWAVWADDSDIDSRSVTKRGAWGDVLAEGHAILRAHDAAVRAAVTASRRTMRIAGHVVPVANVPGNMASDAGHLLCGEWNDPLLTVTTTVVADKHYPVFSATYCDAADGKRHFSLRSPAGGAHVGEIARSIAEKFQRWSETYQRGSTWAGGGHEHAAGFDAPLGWEGE